MIYTVVGFYSDNGQPWVGHVEASDTDQLPENARKQAANDNDCTVDDYPVTELVIIEAFKGGHQGCLGNEEIIDG